MSRHYAALLNFARRSPLSAFWGCVAAAIIAVAVLAPVIAPYEPLKSDFRHMTKPPAAPHYLGTDQIGRDTLSRVIYGSRASLAIAIGAVLFGTTLGASSGAEPARAPMNPPAWTIRSNALRSTTRSLISGNGLARNGSTTMVAPSLNRLM